MKEAAFQAAVAHISAGRLLASAPEFIELLPMGIYACDADGRVRWFNSMAAEIWGRRPRIGDDTERFCGSHKVFSLDGTLLKRNETPMAQALRTGEAIHGRQAMVERPDGSRLTAMVHVNPIKDERGRVIGAINCFSANDEPRAPPRHSEDRAEPDRRLHELLDALPAAVYTTDAKGRITYYNEAAVTLAGRRPALGIDQWSVAWKLYRLDGTPLPHTECPMALALKQNKPVRGYEALAERPDGTRVPFIPFPTPIHDADGNLVGAVNVLVDISERRESEAQQRVLFSELNHRIKNNLQMLLAMLGAAKRRARHPEAITILTEALQRVGAMAAAQQALYRADHAQSYDSQEFMSALYANVAPSLGQGVRMECSATAGELQNVTAVPLALIITELAINAAKHSGGEGSAVEIKVKLQRDADNFLLTVDDNGPGFELKTDRRTSGLNLVTGLARQIGGTFEVSRNTGARCSVRFPVTAQAA